MGLGKIFGTILKVGLGLLGGGIKFGETTVSITPPDSIKAIVAAIAAAEVGFPEAGSGATKVKFVMPFAFQLLVQIFGKPSDENLAAAKVAAEKVASGMVDFWQLIKEDDSAVQPVN